MRRLLILTLLVAGTAFGVGADEGNLSGGVLIAHHNADIQYSVGLDFCDLYSAGNNLASCEDQINRIDINGTQDVSVWYVVAAWDEPKIWCASEFGLGDFNVEAYYFVDWGVCLPNNLEMSTDTWPAPNQGTIVVATDTRWVGNYLPIYYFAGRAYYVDVIPLSEDPSQSFGGFGNCSVPAESWDAELGGMGLFTDGIHLCPPDATHACCDPITGECWLYTEEECSAANGTWLPDMDTCDPDPCVPTPPAVPLSWGEIKSLYQ